QTFGFVAASSGAVEGERLHPGEEFAGQGDEFAPDLVLGEMVQGQVGQAGVLGAADAVFAAGPAAVAEFQVGELAAAGVGDEAGEAVAVEVGEAQLRAGMGPFFAGDDAHAFGPAGQVQQAGQLGHPGAGPDLAVGVVGGRPSAVRQAQDRGLDVVGEGEPDRVRQPPSGPGQPGQELMGAAAGVGADQYLSAALLGELGQGKPGGVDVIGGGVGPGVSGSQQQGQGFAGAVLAVVGEDRHRVEAEGLLPGRGGVLFVGVGNDDGGVDVDRDQLAVGSGCVAAG